MTGLEKIIQEIQAEAAAEAQAAAQAAEAQAADILAKAQAEAAEINEAARLQDEKQAADAAGARQSALALQRRQRTLQQKQQLLAETLQKAREALYALPADDYFALLAKLAAKNALPGEGEMLLNEADSQRVPAGFEASLASGLPSGASLKIAAKTRPIDGGFILKYGDIEVNNSFGAIFDAAEEEMADSIRDTLFGE